tara:strand:+ start:163 stop:402 length:240 start_codon:yes stop_codon:yes gene_type:complete
MKEITIAVPISDDNNPKKRKYVATPAKVSDGTVEYNGEECHLVQHTNSGFRFLANKEYIKDIEDDADETMEALAIEEGF